MLETLYIHLCIHTRDSLESSLYYKPSPCQIRESLHLLDQNNWVRALQRRGARNTTREEVGAKTRELGSGMHSRLLWARSAAGVSLSGACWPMMGALDGCPPSTSRPACWPSETLFYSTTLAKVFRAQEPTGLVLYREE
jgi:hypothetical protein